MVFPLSLLQVSSVFPFSTNGINITTNPQLGLGIVSQVTWKQSRGGGPARSHSAPCTSPASEKIALGDLKMRSGLFR